MAHRAARVDTCSAGWASDLRTMRSGSRWREPTRTGARMPRRAQDLATAAASRPRWPRGWSRRGGFGHGSRPSTPRAGPRRAQTPKSASVIRRFSPIDLVASGVVAPHADNRSALTEVHEGMRSGGAAGSVVVHVLDQALHGHIRDAGHDVEVVPMQMSVQHQAHPTGLLEDTSQLPALLHERKMRTPRPPPRVVERLLAGRVVHQDAGGSARRREVGSEPFDLWIGDANVHAFSLDRVEDHEMPALDVERIVERSGAAPEPIQVFSVEMNQVVIAGNVHEGRFGLSQDGLARPVALEIDLARFIFDVVPEVGHQIGDGLVVHESNEIAGEPLREVRHLAQLAAVANLGSEVEVGDDRYCEVMGHEPRVHKLPSEW